MPKEFVVPTKSRKKLADYLLQISLSVSELEPTLSGSADTVPDKKVVVMGGYQGMSQDYLAYAEITQNAINLLTVIDQACRTCCARGTRLG